MVLKPESFFFKHVFLLKLTKLELKNSNYKQIKNVKVLFTKISLKGDHSFGVLSRFASCSKELMQGNTSILVYKFHPERTGFKMYAEYTRPQLTFLALLPCHVVCMCTVLLVHG